MLNEADFIIVGGGSAGCALAHRLSEDPQHRVVLLEAGPSSDRFWVKVPAGLTRILADPEINWLYSAESDPTLKGRRVIWHAGKMLGGGSSINGMVYIRGSRHDYDGWAANGCTGWSWDEVLPYFKRSERFEGPDSQSHGKHGFLGVAPLRIVHPLADAFIEACTQVGLRTIEEYCDGDLDGAFINYATQQNGQRCSTEHGYLRAAEGRPNLQVETGALVDRVLFDGHRACGVRYVRNGTVRDIRCRGEVIICAGTVQSPAILLRSGIGPGQQLQGFGIDVRVDAKEVGRNLHEHPSMPSMRLVNVPTYNVTKNPLRLGSEVLNYFLFRRGMLSTCSVHAMAHARSRPDLPYPDIKLQMLPLCLEPKTRALHKEYGITITINVTPPASRGEIRLRSSNPADHPSIDHRMYDHPSDLERMRAGHHFANRLFDAPALRKYVVGTLFPEKTVLSDTEWDDLLRQNSSIGFHAVGTCRMGSDESAVVDPSLRVRGVVGLRVADCSIMPLMPSCNTNAPAVMVGEKCADLVKQAAKVS
jgi:choline dehydrogenase